MLTSLIGRTVSGHGKIVVVWFVSGFPPPAATEQNPYPTSSDPPCLKALVENPQGYLSEVWLVGTTLEPEDTRQVVVGDDRTAS